ncbi:HdeD family acid-resistance protein [Actinocorallia longicatena]|uniref:HdeD family acid-resistance protein n=1 Tax=Actinocorallia longicatena TaxID=111803 RepID=A0ABP6QA02_9ACTN
MLDQLARKWWLLALRGVFAILFGIVAWVWPDITVLALAILFGAYALVDGAIALAGAFAGGTPEKSRGWLGFTGVCGIALGLMAMIWPGATAFIILTVIAAWAIVTGVFEIIVAIMTRNVVEGSWWHVAGGAVSVLFGAVLLIWPRGSGLALIWVVGLFSILFGIALVFAAFKLKNLAARTGAGPHPTGATPAF